ncbi:MAG: hypothetical protein ACTSRP_15130 [Candidatus Helarchaeota archaeon]
MFQINIAFFLLGALIFFTTKFISELRLWGEESPPKVPRMWAGTIFFLWMGSIFLFAALNIVGVMIEIAFTSTTPTHGVFYLPPTIVLLVVSIAFIIPVFIRPTINFLIAVLIGLGATLISLVSPIGLFTGLISYVPLKYLVKKYNKYAWDFSESSIIQLFRNDIFEIILIIITFITAWIYIAL